MELLWERLDTGNVLLAAPRRFGKTSVMYRLIDDLRSGWRAIHVDAESIREPANFVIALLDALMADKKIRKLLVSSWQNSCKWVRRLFDNVELTTPWDVGLKLGLKQAMGPNWQERGEALLRALRASDEKLLIVIDELPVMLHLFSDNGVSDADARGFLYWFRKLRPAMGLTNCRFLVGGSIGIEHYLSRLGAADSFNDFERVPLGELSRNKAGELLSRLLKSRRIALSAASQNRVLALVGAPIPYFIQVFVAEIAAAQANGATRIGPKRIEEIYQHRLLGAACKTYFQHYYDRLRHYSKLDEQAAKALLKQMALAKADVQPRAQLRRAYRQVLGEAANDDGFARLVGDLENDFYIHWRPDSEGYGFASKILRDWWRRYYAF